MGLDREVSGSAKVSHQSIKPIDIPIGGKNSSELVEKCILGFVGEELSTQGKIG
jgi:hypothetical protein